MNNLLRSRRLAGAALALVFCAGFSCGMAQAGCDPYAPPTKPDSRYAEVDGAVPAGSEVLDRVTGRVWQRCVLGTVWDGSTCTGTPLTLSYIQSLDAARTAPPSAVPGAGPWRVPQHKELLSLADFNCANPARNTHWFPAVGDEQDVVWGTISTTVIPGFGVLGFNFYYDVGYRFGNAGGGGNEAGAAHMHVRLVRSAGSR